LSVDITPPPGNRVAALAATLSLGYDFAGGAVGSEGSLFGASGVFTGAGAASGRTGVASLAFSLFSLVMTISFK
jgi:hypothetical protein